MAVLVRVGSSILNGWEFTFLVFCYFGVIAALSFLLCVALCNVTGTTLQYILLAQFRPKLYFLIKCFLPRFGGGGGRRGGPFVLEAATC